MEKTKETSTMKTQEININIYVDKANNVPVRQEYKKYLESQMPETNKS